jgi:hypothetical protein
MDHHLMFLSSLCNTICRLSVEIKKKEIATTAKSAWRECSCGYGISCVSIVRTVRTAVLVLTFFIPASAHDFRSRSIPKNPSSTPPSSFLLSPSKPFSQNPKASFSFPRTLLKTNYKFRSSWGRLLFVVVPRVLQVL